MKAVLLSRINSDYKHEAETRSYDIIEVLRVPKVPKYYKPECFDSNWYINCYLHQETFNLMNFI